MRPTIPLAPVRAFAEPPHVDNAVELLAAAPVHAIGFGFTSSAYVLGAAAEDDMLERLRARAGGLPVVSPTAAAVSALRGYGVQRVALRRSSLVRHRAQRAGARLLPRRAIRRGLRRPSRAAERAAENHTGGSLRVDPQERALGRPRRSSSAATASGRSASSMRSRRNSGRPVLTANQVLLWAALRAAGADAAAVSGYGRLFAT